MRLPPILWGALVKTMQAYGGAYRIPQQPQWLLLYYSASPARNLLRDSPCDDDMYTYIWAKIPSVTDASAPRFHQCSPNYEYQQLLTFMAV